MIIITVFNYYIFLPVGVGLYPVLVFIISEFKTVSLFCFSNKRWSSHMSLIHNMHCLVLAQQNPSNYDLLQWTMIKLTAEKKRKTFTSFQLKSKCVLLRTISFENYVGICDIIECCLTSKVQNGLYTIKFKKRYFRLNFNIFVTLYFLPNSWNKKKNCKNFRFYFLQENPP